MDGYKNVVAPFEEEFRRLVEIENTDGLSEETYEQTTQQMGLIQRQRDIAIAEYAGIPSTRRALDELHSAACGNRSSAYAYMVLDELPDDYCAD